MAMFYAQPYDIHASGFYFEDTETYRNKITSIVNDYGDPVEEFEIQFIDGDEIDCELSKSLCLHQGNVVAIMDAMEGWEEHQKLAVIIAAGECGYSFDPAKDDPDSLDVTIYHVDSLKRTGRSSSPRKACLVKSPKTYVSISIMMRWRVIWAWTTWKPR